MKLSVLVIGVSLNHLEKRGKDEIYFLMAEVKEVVKASAVLLALRY